MDYLCADFGLPRPLRSRLRLDVRDRRQTDVRRQTKASLNAPAYWGRGHNNKRWFREIRNYRQISRYILEAVEGRPTVTVGR